MYENIKPIDIKKNVMKIAKEKNMSLSKLGKLSGVPEGTMYHWNKRYPNVSTLMLIANVFGYTIDELIRKE